MNEGLLQFIWRYSLYHPLGLETTEGLPITVVHPGTWNTDAGPDFSKASIRIGTTTLVGNVELHVRSSDWSKHGHDTDAAYQNIILHVVYEDDANNPAHGFPKLVLKPHISREILERYTHLIQTLRPIPCAGQLEEIPALTKEHFLSRMLAERWEQKLTEWKELLSRSKGDWNTLLYWRLACNFGFKVNAVPFLQLAQSIPVNLFARHSGNLLQIEALLFGQAGMLGEHFEDEYARALQREYEYLGVKYQLVPLQKHQWKFLRLRPANFPTVRIAQFAALLHQSLHLFSQIIESTSIDGLRKLLDVTASDYWKDHYRFDEVHGKPFAKRLGPSSVDNLIINTIAPLRFLFSLQQNRLPELEKALQLLHEVPAETNSILSLWQANNWEAGHAAHSQALLQLYNQYCSGKRCLECAIGLGILRGKRV